MAVKMNRPWLEVDLGSDHRVLSWSITAPGYVSTRRLVWREVRNADLPRDLDVVSWLRRAQNAAGYGDAVALLTSRDLRAYETAQRVVDGVRAQSVATVGLSNAERVGARVDRSAQDWGTINIAVWTDLPMTDIALLEMSSVASQARTAAIMDAGPDLPTGRATGTGTDCIAVAAPAGDMAYAGLHTAQGEAVGAVVYEAVRRGTEAWSATVARESRP